MSLFGPPNIEKMVAKKDISGLLSALASNDLSKLNKQLIWTQASDALIAIGDYLVISHLLVNAKHKDCKAEFKHRILFTLARIQDPYASEQMFQLDNSCSLDIINILKEYKKDKWQDYILERLSKGSPEERVGIFTTFFNAKDPTLLKIMPTLNFHDNFDVQIAASNYLECIEEDIIPFAYTQLNNGNFEFVRLVVSAKCFTSRFSQQTQQDDKIDDFLISCLNSTDYNLKNTASVYAREYKGIKKHEISIALQQAQTYLAEQQFYRYPETWIANTENRTFLIQMINSPYTPTPGRDCPYFSLGICMFRVQSKKDSSMGPEKCSLEWPPDKSKWHGWNHRNCFVWQMDPK